MLYWIGYFFCVCLSKIFFPITLKGADNIPRTGGFLIASNHSSNLDPFVIGISIKRRLNFLAKHSLFKNKILGFILSSWGAFPLKRETRDIGAIKESLKRLRRGQGLLIFPEGTRITSRNRRKIQSGVAFLAVKADAPIIPVNIKTSHRVLFPKSRFFKRTAITLHFGKAISYTASDSYPAIAYQTMNAIDHLSESS